jgi:hypothetical protein
MKVIREREILVEVLNHLREIDRRKLFLDHGFSSLWEEMQVKESRRVLTAEASELKLIVSNKLLTKLEEVKALMSHKNPNAGLPELLEIMADYVIAKKNPSKTNPAKKDAAARPPLRRLQKRTSIPVAIKREVWQKAGRDPGQFDGD